MVSSSVNCCEYAVLGDANFCLRLLATLLLTPVTFPETIGALAWRRSHREVRVIGEFK
ncbi:hypothetical protein PN499_19170 [Kamptonema animale CS-326]|uniref:hypothetical protein n=1 Tax=Kamptonema TaxID=1501433 RepID=UPI0012D7EBC6|nr:MULTISPECIES: hypothetical protein [Kamptonema]MDB9513319.1 hypothetical protein [Kamptonema animale CS-326]HLO51372.1 hypothetical protein [Kamptonema sp.]